MVSALKLAAAFTKENKTIGSEEFLLDCSLWKCLFGMTATEIMDAVNLEGIHFPSGMEKKISTQAIPAKRASHGYLHQGQKHRFNCIFDGDIPQG